MSWKEVFNTNHKFWWDIMGATEGAWDAGYKYMSWNGWVYEIEAINACRQLDIKSEDLI
jgi:hypothetical protein